jgi:hypothetical protein
MHFHTVLFQFAEGTSDETIDDVLEHLRAMEAIPCVRRIVVGANMMPVVDGWSHGMTMEFDSYQVMREEFGSHPLHLEVLRNQLPVFSRYMAMDLELNA